MGMDMEGAISVKTFHKSKIEFQKEIGSGSFGKVWKAILKESKKQIAVKVFYQEFIGILPNVDSKLRTSAYDELAKVAVLDHENIVRLLGMVEDDIPWLIFEYMKDGNLLEYVMRKKDVNERTLIRWCKDICNGMSFLHRNNFLHKDLAARNILLDGKIAKIADLGLCSFLTEDNNGSYALGGKLFPYRHAASECIVECIYTFESDVWSFGVLLFEIFTRGSVPYGSENKQPEVRRFIADGMNPTNFLEPTCSINILTAMQSIFVTKREDRPTFDDLLQYFESMLSNKGIKIPRPHRDVSPSPFRVQHQRLQELSGSSQFLSTGSSDRLSNSPPSSSNNLGTPPIGNSNPDISSPNGSIRGYHHHGHHSHKQTNLLGVSPPKVYEERRYSETPPRGVLLAVIDGGERGRDRSHSPRRAASFSNVPKPEGFKSHQQVEQQQNRLFKDFVPNRFKK